MLCRKLPSSSLRLYKNPSIKMTFWSPVKILYCCLVSQKSSFKISKNYILVANKLSSCGTSKFLLVRSRVLLLVFYLSLRLIPNKTHLWPPIKTMFLPGSSIKITFWSPVKKLNQSTFWYPKNPHLKPQKIIFWSPTDCPFVQQIPSWYLKRRQV